MQVIRGLFAFENYLVYISMVNFIFYFLKEEEEERPREPCIGKVSRIF